MPGVGMFDGLCHEEEGYGAQLKKRARQVYGTYIGFAGRGEMIPNPDTYCEIDPDVVDQWGIPALRFHFKWSEYELRQAKDMQETFRAIVESMGGEYKTENFHRRPVSLRHRSRAAASSTKWAPRAWAPTRKPPSSTASARRTT